MVCLRHANVVQSSLIRGSQSLPKRDGPEPSTTISGTSALWSWYLRRAISCPCTLSGCSMYALRQVLDGMRGVPMKCFLQVSFEMTKTPAPVSNFIRREVPILVAITVMFSGKQTTTRKMEDQQKNCINQRAHGFYSNRIYTPTNGRSYMLISGPNLPTISSCFKRLKGFLNLKLIK